MHAEKGKDAGLLVNGEARYVARSQLVRERGGGEVTEKELRFNLIRFIF